jgi:hypothetical protein
MKALLSMVTLVRIAVAVTAVGVNPAPGVLAGLLLSRKRFVLDDGGVGRAALAR